jgi:hypothetical protein
MIQPIFALFPPLACKHITHLEVNEHDDLSETCIEWQNTNQYDWRNTNKLWGYNGQSWDIMGCLVYVMEYDGFV